MKYFSTFSGIGGFELGIKQAYESNNEHAHKCKKSKQEECSQGRERTVDKHRIQLHNRNRTAPLCVGYSEIDKYAIQVYNKQFNHKNYGDITRIRTKDLPNFDLLVGGFPCQAFSIAGKRKGFDDTRGTLFFDLARILADKRPRNFVFENVKGLLSHDSGKTFQTILGVLSDLGYRVEWQVLNSKNFGVPQNRERVFIVGHLGGGSGQQIFPIGESNCEDIVLPTITTRVTADSNGSYVCKKQTQEIKQLNNPAHSNDRVYSEKGLSPTLNTMQGGNRQPFIKTNKKNYGKLDDRTLESKEGLQKQKGDLFGMQQGEENRDTSHRQGLAQQQTDKSSGNMSELPQQNSSTKEDVQNLRKTTERIGVLRETLSEVQKVGESTKDKTQSVLRGSRIRRLTPTETERLQGFPDDWTKLGIDKESNEVEISNSQRYKMCGNAVTVNVVENVISRIL